jgi:hypothetical protein
MNIFTQVDAHIGTRIEVASRSRFSVFTRDTTVKNREEMFRQVRTLLQAEVVTEMSPLGEMESALAA